MIHPRRYLALCVLIAGLLLLVVRTLRDEETGSSTGTHDCLLEAERGGWCETCSAGSLAAMRIESRMLFEALDAHGHEVDPESFDCAGCSLAVTTGGYCEECNRGFVEGQAYLSPLSYHLARGDVIVPSELRCDLCRENAESLGWCSDCARGVVGNIAIGDPLEHAIVAEKVRILRRAMALAGDCEICAAAMVVDGTCSRCRIDYRDGEAR